MEVFLATPAYDGKVVPQFVEPLKESLRVLKDAGIPAQWESLSGCCYLPIARNKLVKQFLESGMSDLVFIDADIEWTPDDLVRLLAWPVEIVGAAYRHKTWEETYPVWIKTNPDNTPRMGGLSDLIECWSVPTGFMRITRSVFTAMQQHYGEQLEIEEYTQDAKPTGEYLNFFDTGRVGRQWWGEDCNFCRQWTMEMGRQLWVDPQIVLSHWGKSSHGEDQPFRGSFHEYLSRLPGGANDPGYHGSGIDGWLTLCEAQWLFTRALRMESIVEVGSYLGKSSHALLSGCSGSVTCIDPWGVLGWKDGDTEENAEQRFRDFMANTASFPNRIIKRTTSIDAAKDYPDGSVDMVFLDGDHAYSSVMEDIKAWLPKARKLICGHDYNFYGWPEVKQVVDDRFGDRVQVSGTIWFVEL